MLTVVRIVISLEHHYGSFLMLRQGPRGCSRPRFSAGLARRFGVSDAPWRTLRRALGGGAPVAAFAP